jgi:hypothetical protein
VKFAKLLVLAEFIALGPNSWMNTLVTPGGGLISPGSMEVRDGHFGEFLIDRVVRFETLRRQGASMMSPTQKQKIWDHFVSNPSFQSTEATQALIRDWSWNSAIPKVSRNAPCPCGSGKKYKRCHGM